MADVEKLGVGGGVDPRESGKILKAARLKRGLTQGQLIEAVGIPNQSYLSALENGRYNIANSEYLPALARALDLSIEQVRAISPTAVIEISAPEVPAEPDDFLPGFPAPLYERTDEIYMPQGLQDAIDRYGDDPEYAPLKDEDVQRQLAMVRGFNGGPQTAGEWLSFYLANKRWLDKN